MVDLHALLRLQLRKHFGSGGVPESLQRFVDEVNEAYLQADDKRRMLESALELSSLKLLNSNAELSAALETLAGAAELTAQASRAKDEFLAMLGHELRNPLAPIVTSLEVAKLKGVSVIDAHDIERPVRQLLRFVDDLPDIARLARGALVGEQRLLEMSHAVRNAVEGIQPAAKQRGQVGRVEVPADRVMVDEDEINRPIGRRRKILVVDDNREAANLIGEALRLSGHQVALAYQASEALLQLAQFTPDIALLDIRLTDMSGHELAKELRKRHATLKLIALTGNGQPSDIEASQRAGFATHLVKPIGLRELLDVIDEA